MVLHSSSINIMLVKSKNCFVDLSLTPTRFLAPNFLITAEHESLPHPPPPQKTQLETRKCNYSRMKVWVLHEARPQWKPGKKTTFPVTRLYLEALDGVLILTIFLPAAVCVWGSSLNHSGSSPNPLKAACWSRFLLWLDLIWGYRLFQSLTKSRQISSN